MKRKNMKAALTALLAVLLCLFCMGASAEEERQIHTATGEFFQTGGMPAVSLRPQTYSLRGNSLENYIVVQLEAQAEEIVIEAYGVTVAELDALFIGIINSHPEMFYVNNEWGRSAVGNPETEEEFLACTAYALYPEYKYSGAVLEERVAAFEAKVSQIAAYASGASTTLGRLMRVNDYFCVNFRYDTSYSNYAADELLLEGTGVCQAYMLGYRAVLDRLGITSTTASSDAMNHTWNMVYLDGAWYHIDVTWNDPLSDMPYRACHDNFLVSDSAMTASRGHYGWEAPVSADSTKYDDYFWVPQVSPVPVIGDTMYYVGGSSDCTIYSWTASAGSAAIHSFDSCSETGYYMPDGYHPLGATKSRLYYATADAVYSIPAEGGDPVKEFSTGDPKNCIETGYLSGTTMYLYNGAKHSFTIGQTPVISLDSTLIELTEGESVQLTAEIDPEGTEIIWSTGDSAAATADENGLVTGVEAGFARVAVTAGVTEVECIVIVHAEEQIIVPDTVVEIKEGAFANSGAVDVVLPEGLEILGDKAFRNCTGLKLVALPESLESISVSAFDGCSEVALLVKEGSRAHEYAAGLEMFYILVP